MTALSLPHTLDLYSPGANGSGPTLVRSEVPGYFDMVSALGRERLQDVARSKVALLWLDLSARSAAADGMQAYWREQGTWWTMRGMPDVFEAPGLGHIEVLAAANALDSFFSSVTATVPLTTQLTAASSVTGMKVELSTAPDFSSLALTAVSSGSQVGWYYASGGQWVPFPAGGLPTQPTQTIAYFPVGLAAGQHYYVRWTPYAGSAPLTVQLAVVAA